MNNTYNTYNTQYEEVEAAESAYNEEIQHLNEMYIFEQAEYYITVGGF